VTVNCLAAGRVSTLDDRQSPESAQNDAWIAGQPIARMGTPEKIALAVAFLSTEAADYITGPEALAIEYVDDQVAAPAAL
jgi:3-oxoacyl-[acyl-carrier protein] reductase